MEGRETLRGRMKFEGRLLRKHAKFMKSSEKWMRICNKKKTAPTSPQKSDLGASWASFGRVRGRLWEGFGGSWGFLGRFWRYFLMLVFGVVFRHALGGILAGLGIDLGGFGEGFERASWGLLGYSPNASIPSNGSNLPNVSHLHNNAPP